MTAASQKLLVVDGETFIRQYFKTLFKDYQVHVCATGEEAVRILEQEPDTQVLVTDLAVGGRRLLQHCKARHPHIIRVVLTDSMDQAALLESVNTGEVFRFVSKPYSPADLAQTVHQAFEVHALQQEKQRLVDALQELNSDLEHKVQRQTRHLEEKTAQLEDLNRFKDELLMIAAHDLRSPLSVMVGYANMLQETEPELSPTGQTVVQRIQVTGNRLLSMVNNILSLAALEEGRSELEYEPCRLSDIVNEVYDSLAGMIDDNRIAFETDVEGDDTVYFLDRIKVAQVLQNLVSNAIKFTEAGGRITLRGKGEPHRVTFSVSDTGHGLSNDQAQRVFDKFSRFSGNTHHGSGLGLAIAKSIVQLHGGTISVESEPGQGSTFTFTVAPRPQSEVAEP